ncbi:MAG: NAD(P)-dependent alcohol dehydrogenase, partial [Chloroflexota bacterium]
QPSLPLTLKKVGSKMKAIVYTKYGSPHVLHLEDLEKPSPKDNEVLIKVHAASVNPADWHTMRGAPFLARLANGLFKPKNPRLGSDVAGCVEAIGRNVTQFQVGQDVFGCLPLDSMSSFAEYITADADRLALKPAMLTFEQAAAVPLAALTALQGLRDYGKIQAGQKVLVNGASGGVGTFAVQIAKSFGAMVTGVCSTRNLELVRAIDADQVVDYTKEDFAQNGQIYDLIFDTIGNLSMDDARRALSPNGICVVAGFSTMLHALQLMIMGPRVSKRGSKKIGLMSVVPENQKDLLTLKELLETGKIVPVIDQCYPLSETSEAVRYLETGRARGKVVISVEQKNVN